MASSRRGQPPLSVRLPPAAAAAAIELPPLSALFLIDFDVKAGYTIIWKRCDADIELEGLVEYKSLPSGLHTVSDDLIYFIHEGGHAGLSAFVNMPCEEEGTRNARMIAVGVLVPLSEGRLGRAWRHAEGLKEFATKLAQDRSRTDLLEAYWNKNSTATSANGPAPASGAHEARTETPLEPPLLDSQTARLMKSHTRNRSASDGTILVPPGHKLSSYHPAWSLNALLDTFGPLIFPIQRAALLRKRILISCQTPVHEICNFVYDISVLSNIPHSVTEMLGGASGAPPPRLRPLFNIGVHDIAFLVDDAEAARQLATGERSATQDGMGTGWIACTTDSILAMKDTLWDMLITMPPNHSANAKDRTWPTVECPKGVPVRATQRDLRRFRTLKAGLARLTATTPHPQTATLEEPPSGASPGIKSSNTSTALGAVDSEEALDRVVEPITWTELAYTGFLWWASAGEQARGEEQEEAAHDAALLADLGPAPATRSSGSISADAGLAGVSESVSSLTAAVQRPGVSDEEEAKTELAIIAYFHRLTTQIISIMGELVDSADSDGYEPYTDEEDGDEPRARAGGNTSAVVDEGDEDEAQVGDEEQTPLRPRSDIVEPVRVPSHVMESMGLDVWNDHDAEFAKELMERYFGREARVEGKGVEVCGLRVC